MVVQYKCDFCDYSTNNKYNYTVHNKTAKHLRMVQSKHARNLQEGCISVVRKVGKSSDPSGEAQEHPIRPQILVCKFCGKTISCINVRARHYRRCQAKRELDQQEYVQRILKEKEELLKEKEAAEIRAAEAEKIAIAKGNTVNNTVNNNSINTVNNNTVNNSQLNVYYVIKNYTDAHNYEDLMGPALTKEEIKHAKQYGPSAGCERLIENRCIKGIEKEKRPIHCVDAARAKFMLRTKGVWKTNVDTNKILKPAFDHMRSQYDISDKNTDIDDRVNNQRLLLEMDIIGGKKTIKYLTKEASLKNTN